MLPYVIEAIPIALYFSLFSTFKRTNLFRTAYLLGRVRKSCAVGFFVS